MRSSPVNNAARLKLGERSRYFARQIRASRCSRSEGMQDTGVKVYLVEKWIIILEPPGEEIGRFARLASGVGCSIMIGRGCK